MLTNLIFSMAEDAVNAAIKSGKLNPVNNCVTSNFCLVGGDGWYPAFFTVLAQEYVRMKKAENRAIIPGEMDTAAAKHLSHSYGTMAERVASIAQVLHHLIIKHICPNIIKNGLVKY